MGGVDFPRTWAEFVAWFPDDKACVAYLERLRWGDGFVCPGCGGDAVLASQPRGRLQGLRRVCAAHVSHRWNGVRRYAVAADPVVRRRLACGAAPLERTCAYAA